MKKTALMLVALLGMFVAQAQIPAEVTDVMNRCKAAMTNPSGIEYEMNMKAGMGIISMNIYVVNATKGTKHRTTVSTKVLGIEVTTEDGFNGTESWHITHTDEADTITISRGPSNTKLKGELEWDYAKRYKKAKMKVSDGYYVITFSEPVDKSNEAKSVVIKVSTKNYTLHEIKSGARGAKVTMTITKIRIGLSDNYFKLDLDRYPNAVVIRN